MVDSTGARNANERHIETRYFIRHPSDVPLEVQPESVPSPKEESLSNVSVGGLTFVSEVPYERDQILKVIIRLVNPVFEARGRVVWSRGGSGRYEIGIEFINTKDIFRIRMVEQICHIEHYKKEITSREGRLISGREAALEWIDKHAGSFESEMFEHIEK